MCFWEGEAAEEDGFVFVFCFVGGEDEGVFAAVSFGVFGVVVVVSFEGLLMLRDRDAGGPTETILEPNSTPMVTSWWGEKRPSHRRIVS